MKRLSSYVMLLCSHHFHLTSCLVCFHLLLSFPFLFHAPLSCCPPPHRPPPWKWIILDAWSLKRWKADLKDPSGHCVTKGHGRRLFGVQPNSCCWSSTKIGWGSTYPPSMGCGVSNEMPLVEEDAISRDVRKTRESSSGKGTGAFHSAGQSKEGNLVLALSSIRFSWNFYHFRQKWIFCLKWTK